MTTFTLCVQENKGSILSSRAPFLALTRERALGRAVDQVVESKLELGYNLSIQGLHYREFFKSKVDFDVVSLQCVPIQVLIAYVQGREKSSDTL